MYERLLNKNSPPSIDYIIEYIGESNYKLLLEFEAFLGSNYSLTKELKFPFGNNYGWGFKYSHKSSHLCYLLFESGAFTILLQIGDNNISNLERVLPSLSDKSKDLWKNRYPCGKQGGWIHYRVVNSNELNDIYELIKVRKKPVILNE